MTHEFKPDMENLQLLVSKAKQDQQESSVSLAEVAAKNYAKLKKAAAIPASNKEQA